MQLNLTAARDRLRFVDPFGAVWLPIGSEARVRLLDLFVSEATA